MQLTELLSPYAKDYELPSVEIKAITMDSREVKKGSLFIAIQGSKLDGRNFIMEAVENGASAILCAPLKSDFSSIDVPIIAIPRINEKMSEIAARFYGYPSKGMSVIGITGTNGKTTVAYLLYQALKQLGQKVAMIGTLGVVYEQFQAECPLTTPDPITLAKIFAKLKEMGATTVVMEVSSHGLSQHRVDSLDFESALFTNLSQDHLDYHQSMSQYAKAKARLFQWPSLKRAVINSQSQYSDVMQSPLKGRVETVQYALEPIYQFAPLKVFAHSYETKPNGMYAKITTPWGDVEINSRLLGNFNLANTLCVLSELCLQGYNLKKIIPVLERCQAPPGRMQRFGGGAYPEVIVDYAHTPDALKKALLAARSHCRRRLWCVFGCGGERDMDKRPLMGEMAANLADKIIITNDNPRREPSRQIVQDIMKGIPTEMHAKIELELDRQSAIKLAISRALSTDVILIAGKGHEPYQLIGTTRHVQSDLDLVRKTVGGNCNALV